MAEGRSLTPGIIYLGRIPPFMKPVKIRHIFSAYGEVHRVYLQPEDEKMRKTRSKQGGSRKVRFTEGWVEFKDKRIAKRVAAALNNTQIGGKKRSMYYDDLWCMKYLSGFHWSDLGEKIHFENAVADKKERAELAQTKRENEFYKQNIDKAKALVAMSQRTRKHETGAASAAPSTTSAGASAGAEGGASSARKAAGIIALPSSKAWDFKQVAPAPKRPKISLSKIISRSSD